MSYKGGRVLFSALVDPSIRDQAREAARLSGLHFSQWVERTVQQAVARESAARTAQHAMARGECVTCGHAPCVQASSAGPLFDGAP